MGTTAMRVVLVVDDDKGIRDGAGHFFRLHDYYPITASSFDGAIRETHEREDDIFAVVDLNLIGERNGFDLLEYFRDAAPGRVTAVAFTGDSSITTERKAVVDCGALAVVHKTGTPNDYDRLLVYADASHKKKRDNDKDEMTGLDKYGYFSRVVRAEFRAARTRKGVKIFSLVLFDIDHFKTLNEKWGYLVGDKALKAVARILEAQVRPSDHLCRKGDASDEFLVCMPDEFGDEAFKFGRRVQEAASRLSLADQHGNPVAVTISFGFGELRTIEIDPVKVQEGLDQLVWRADKGPTGIKELRKLAGHVSDR